MCCACFGVALRRFAAWIVWLQLVGLVFERVVDVA